MARGSVFQSVQLQAPGRSKFDLSYDKKFTADMGYLYPVLCDECLPGDIWRMGNEIVIRMQPLVAPIMHEINAFVHYFYVPYRLLWDDWEHFISGVKAKNFDYVTEPPTWNATGADCAVGSLWDYFGFPTDVERGGYDPLDFPRRAYNLIFNEYYRDENLDDEVPADSNKLLRRRWHKDYFTSALPWQQKGTSPALPLSGTTSAMWPVEDFAAAGTATGLGFGITQDPVSGQFTTQFTTSGSGYDEAPQLLRDQFNSNEVDFAAAATFNVADLRLAFQIQRWEERNALSGTRYTELLRAHFGVSPRDETLQRPVFIGGTRSPIIISEVLQTSSTDATSPQGNLAGHGITADRTYAGKYFSREYGMVIGLLSLMPRADYQQGIDRQWLRRTKYDFYFPEFSHLSEQAVESGELFVSPTEEENKSIFGYQGRYNELRFKRNQICGQLRNTLSYWHIGRIFETKPLLNSSFIECAPDKRIFAVPTEPGFIVTVGNILDVVRPMPYYATPGWIDHF